MNSDKKNTSYKDAGVDIAAGNKLVNIIKPFVSSTARQGSNAEIGGFGGIFDLAPLKYKDPLLVSSTDGVGTKLKIAIQTKKNDTIGIDLVAMCVNDLVVQGAEPLFFLDYFATGKLEIHVASEIIKGISNGCIEAGCALIGGETAEMPGHYVNNDYDLAGFSVGILERDNLLPKLSEITSGDVIIGIESSGIHSNGYSLVRYLLKKYEINLSGPAPFKAGYSLGEALLEPTRIYVKSCLEASSKNYVKAYAHITGGGITENLPRILPNNKVAKINLKSWEFPEIFNWLMKLGNIEKKEMLKTFNCGIGMIAICSSEKVNDFIDIMKKHNLGVYIIGEIADSSNEKPFVQYID